MAKSSEAPIFHTEGGVSFQVIEGEVIVDPETGKYAHIDLKGTVRRAGLDDMPKKTVLKRNPDGTEEVLIPKIPF